MFSTVTRCLIWIKSVRRISLRVNRMHSYTSAFVQYWSLFNWRNLRFGCGFIAVPVNWKFAVISPWFAIFKNVVHVWSLVRRRYTYMCNVLNIAKYLKTVRCGCGYFYNSLKTSTVHSLSSIAQSCINVGQNQPLCKPPRTELICYLDFVSDKIMCKNNNLGQFQVFVWRNTPYIWY